MTAPQSSASVLSQFVERARHLYSLPAIALRVLELTNSPKVDVRALKECIENDPALTTKILRVVNSSLFGLTREVSDLNQAIALLGTKPLKMLVLGFSLPKNLFTSLEAEVLSRYWRHTLTKAVIARELAQRLWQRSGEEAFIAGLLQEIGELVLIQDLGEPYTRFVNRVYESGADLMTLELETLGFDHAVLSARLLDHWGLPHVIVQAVGMPHQALRVLELPPAEQTLPQILHLADLIARMLNNDQAKLLSELLDAGRLYRRLTLDDLPLLLEDLEAKVQQLADVLKLEIAHEHNYTDVLHNAYERLSEVAEEAAREMTAAAQVWQEATELSQAMIAATQSQSPRRRNVEPDPPTKPTTSLPRAGISETSATQTRRAIAPTKTVAWSDPGLDGRVATALTQCRQARKPLSLVLLEVDHYDSWIIVQGREGTERLMRLVAAQLISTFGNAGSVAHLGDGQFAIVLEDYDRSQAAELTRDVLDSIRPWAQQNAEQFGQMLCISMGLSSIALPPKNFPAWEMVAAAQRCLQGAQLSGGDAVKSIELV